MSKTYAQFTREIAALQASAERQLVVESKGAVAKINDMIAKYKLTASDLKFASSTSVPVQKSRVSGSAKAQGKNAGNTKRYSDGQGNVWGGRGPRPLWLRSAIAAGRAIESFLTGGSPATAAAPEVAKAPAAKSAPAKKSARKAVAGKPAAKKAAAASQSTSKAVAKKPAAKKAPAKKSPAVQSTPKAAAKKSPTAKKSAVKAKAAPAAKKTSASKDPAVPATSPPVSTAT